ncbi:TPA: AIPR family protein [Streptococcus suis]
MSNEKRANSHDYDIVFNESLHYANEYLGRDIHENNIEKARIGFYYLVFDLLFEVKDRHDADSYIIDDHFSDLVKKKTNIDLGVDAVLIQEEEKKVYLFNFKFRKQFRQSAKAPKYEEIRSAEPFLTLVENDEEFNKFKERSDFEKHSDTYKKIEEIRELIQQDNFSFYLYMVTNDLSNIDEDDPGTMPFKRNYPWITLVSYNLSSIAKEIALTSPENRAIIEVENTSLLEHNVPYTNSKSYITEMSLIDVARISSTDLDLRERTSINNIEEILNLELDFDILFDNVRDYLGSNKINKKITKTLSEEPYNFFLFNNGLTVIAEDIKSEPIKLNKSTSLTLKNYQVVNGGQTLRSIYQFKNNNRIKNETDFIDSLSNATVLVRLLVTSSNEELINKISEFTNSQNPIKEIDLRSVDNIQLKIERRLDQENIRYERKRGKGRNFSKKYDYTVSMERLGQILFSYEGKPESAANNKSKIFSDYYEKLFNDDKDLLEKIIQQIKLYKEIGEKYKQVDHEYYEQKAYYILYLKRCLPKLSVENSIELLEKFLKDYVPDKETTEARKFLQPKFRKEIDGKIGELGGTIKGSLIKHSQRKEKRQKKQKVSESKLVYTENDHQQDKDIQILEYYENFKKRLIKQFPNIIIEPKKHYIAFKNNGSNIVDVEIQKRQLKLTINAKKGTLKDPNNILKDISLKGHLGNGDYQVIIKDESNFDKLLEIIKQVVFL